VNKESLCVAVLEIHSLSTACVVADVAVKAGRVHIAGIESNALGGMAIKLVGPTADVQAAADGGGAAADRMHARIAVTVMPRFPADGHWLIRSPQVYNAILEAYDHFLPPAEQSDGHTQEDGMSDAFALGLIETQGLVAVLEATDAMLKAGKVEVVGKEKIGAAYVTVMVKGDVAAVKAAVQAGTAAVEALGQKLICAHVIPRPHADLTVLLPSRSG
jgi:microcompartment protein CcmL/EutN